MTTASSKDDQKALSQAHIGISTNIRGSQICKEKSSFVIQNDTFASILAAVEEGRNHNLKMNAFFKFVVATNMGEVVCIFVSAIFNLPTIFNFA